MVNSFADGMRFRNWYVVVASAGNGIHCAYLPYKERVLLCDSHAIGVRRDLNGMLLLDTALQTSVANTDDIVTVELPLPEVRTNCIIISIIVVLVIIVS